MTEYRGKHSTGMAVRASLVPRRGRQAAHAAGHGRLTVPSFSLASLRFGRGRVKPAMIVTSALAAIVVSAVPFAAQAYESQALRNQYDQAFAAVQNSRETLVRATGYAASASYSAGDLPTSMSIMVDSLKSQLSRADTLERQSGLASQSSAVGGEKLAQAISALDRTSRNQTETAHAITQIVNDLEQYHGLKQVADADMTLNSALSAARAAIDAPNWRSGDDQVKNALDALSKAVNAADFVDRHDLSAMQQVTTSLTDGMRTLTDAIAAHDAAAASAAAAAAAQPRSDRDSTASSTRRSRSSTTQGDVGYTLAGDCYTASQCQAQIDVAGHNQLHALHTAKGSTYYEIHNDHGGSSTWGKSSVTINGVTHNLGQWRPARYNAAGQPIEESEQGTYFQTCDSNGKVWFAPIQ